MSVDRDSVDADLIGLVDNISLGGRVIISLVTQSVPPVNISTLIINNIMVVVDGPLIGIGTN